MIARCMLPALYAAALCGQGQYVFRHAFSLAGATGAWTLQQPATGGLRVNFKYLTISTDAAMKISFERQCTTPATSTSIPIQRVNPEYTSINAKVTGWHTSNASGCTVQYGPIDIFPGATTISLPTDYLSGSGTDKGITLRTSSVTAAGSINWHFEEVK